MSYAHLIISSKKGRQVYYTLLLSVCFIMNKKKEGDIWNIGFKHLFVKQEIFLFMRPLVLHYTSDIDYIFFFFLKDGIFSLFVVIVCV